MSNLEFLQKINAIIVKIDSKYYAYIPNIIGGYIDNGYQKGIYVLLDSEFLSNDNLENFVNDYINEFDINDIDNNIYFSTSLKSDTDKTLEDINSSIVVSDTHNYSYYAILNKITNTFTEEEIDNAYKTFATIVQDYAYLTDISILTQIYQKIIEFYANGQTDSTLTNLRLMLESGSYNYTNTSNYTNCGCNSTQSNLLGTNTTVNCTDSYLQSIQMYMIQMFADLNFYYNFFFIDNNETNEEMIDYLIELLNGVLEKLNRFQQIGQNTSTNNHCKCPSEYTVDKTVNNIILNYIKVLNWVKNCEIEENTNKIQVYGKQFGEIFTNLYFI